MRHANVFLFYFFILFFFLAYANSEGPDQPANLRSLIRAFTVRQQNDRSLPNVLMESEGPDDTLRMRMIT